MPQQKRGCARTAVVVVHVAVVVREAPGQERRTRGPARGLDGRVVDKADAACGDATREVGHEGEPVLLVVRLQVVGQNNDKVRPAGGRRGARLRATECTRL